MVNAAKNTKDDAQKVNPSPKTVKSFEVVAPGGVYVREVADLNCESETVLEEGTVVEAVKVFDEWIKTKEGYIYKKPYTLKEVTI